MTQNCAKRKIQTGTLETRPNTKHDKGKGIAHISISKPVFNPKIPSALCPTAREKLSDIGPQQTALIFHNNPETNPKPNEEIIDCMAPEKLNLAIVPYVKSTQS